jgi:hypothetical protein
MTDYNLYIYKFNSIDSTNIKITRCQFLLLHWYILYYFVQQVITNEVIRMIDGIRNGVNYSVSKYDFM